VRSNVRKPRRGSLTRAYPVEENTAAMLVAIYTRIVAPASRAVVVLDIAGALTTGWAVWDRQLPAPDEMS
jgi:hypothetical protein